MSYNPDDINLLHADRVYDPQKAREYYLRTRKLKGRRPTTASIESPGRGGRRIQTIRPQGSPSVRPAGKGNSRQAELKAQKEALEKRLDRLKEVLREAVAAAKARSGGDPNKSSSESEKDKAPETPKDKADRNKEQKKDKPESPAQKKERAKKAKEAYEKENPGSLSQDVEILQAQVRDIREKIQKALANSKSRNGKGSAQIETVRPRGRAQIETARPQTRTRIENAGTPSISSRPRGGR